MKRIVVVAPDGRWAFWLGADEADRADELVAVLGDGWSWRFGA